VQPAAKAARRQAAAASPPPIFRGIAFLISACSDVAKAQAQALIAAHGGTVLSAVPAAPPAGGAGPGWWPRGALAVITPRFARTPKCLFALAARAPLLLPAWLDACAAAGRLLPPRGAHALSESRGGFDKSEKGGGGGGAHPSFPLQGVRCEAAGATRWAQDIAPLLRHAGAAPVQRRTSGDGGGITLICQDAACALTWRSAAPQQQARKARCVNIEWLVDSLLAGQPADVAAYPVAGLAPFADETDEDDDVADLAAVVPAAAVTPAARRRSAPLGRGAAPAASAQASRRGGAAAAAAEAPQPGGGARRSSGGTARGRAEGGSTARTPRGAAAGTAVPDDAPLLSPDGAALRRGPHAAAMSRCREPLPRADLFAAPRACVCSSDGHCVLVKSGCASCGAPLCLRGQDNCFVQHMRRAMAA
jgi:hypothetical protein